jgi:hypothetical protein
MNYYGNLVFNFTRMVKVMSVYNWLVWKVRELCQMLDEKYLGLKLFPLRTILASAFSLS